jgi:ABC-type sulfate/molybdate transport systems ATPase subunit
MILQYYIFPNPGLIQKWESKRQGLMDDLQFVAAELIRKQLRTMAAFQKRLKFLFVSKELNLNFKYHDMIFEIKQGLIEKISRKDEVVDFPLRDLEFRDNEFLALEKDNLAEAYFIYDKVQEIEPKMVEEIYQKNKQKLREKLL